MKKTMKRGKRPQIGVQETYNFRELGGTVIVRGLLPNEAAGIQASIQQYILPEREQKAAFLVLALKNGIVRPELSEVEVMDLILEHNKTAEKLARRIQALTQGHLRNLPYIED